jgi:hypothetical protein
MFDTADQHTKPRWQRGRTYTTRGKGIGPGANSGLIFLTCRATTTTGITMNITDPDQSFPRGIYMGTPSRPMCEVERFKRCPVCGGCVDILDLSWVTDHEGPLPHPVQDRVQ